MLEGAWIPKCLPGKQLPRNAAQPVVTVNCTRNKILLCQEAEIWRLLIISFFEFSYLPVNLNFFKQMMEAWILYMLL